MTQSRSARSKSSRATGESAETAKGDAEPRWPSAGFAYSGLIADQLRDERARASSLEQRGMAVVSTSGVVVALLGGLAAIATRSESVVLPCSARPFLIIAGVLFLGAIGCGIGANWPRRYRESGLEDLDALLKKEQWDAYTSEGERRVAKHRRELLRVHRGVNGTKAELLKWAMVLEAAAILSAAIAVGIILLGA